MHILKSIQAIKIVEHFHEQRIFRIFAIFPDAYRSDLCVRMMYFSIE